MAMVKQRDPVSVRHPVTGHYTTLARGMDFPDDDPIVKAYPWAFVDEPVPVYVESVSVERATQAPGERRRTVRIRKGTAGE